MPGTRPPRNSPESDFPKTRFAQTIGVEESPVLIDPEFANQPMSNLTSDFVKKITKSAHLRVDHQTRVSVDCSASGVVHFLSALNGLRIILFKTRLMTWQRLDQPQN